MRMRLGVGQQAAGLDRQQDILQAGICWIDVMDIIGGYKVGIDSVCPVSAGAC